jgi:hypothetical protein
MILDFCKFKRTVYKYNNYGLTKISEACVKFEPIDEKDHV